MFAIYSPASLIVRTEPQSEKSKEEQGRRAEKLGGRSRKSAVTEAKKEVPAKLNLSGKLGEPLSVDSLSSDCGSFHCCSCKGGSGALLW